MTRGRSSTIFAAVAVLVPPRCASSQRSAGVGGALAGGDACSRWPRIYVLLDAQFIAAIQVLVYAGAVMVLFLFVIMLLNMGHARRDMRGPAPSPPRW